MVLSGLSSSRVSTTPGPWSRVTPQAGYSHSLSSPLNVLHPAYHSGSEPLKLFNPGARATQYGWAILQAGAMELLNNCRSEEGMPWLCARSARLGCRIWGSLQFPCLRTVEEERVVWTKDKRDFWHRIACSPGFLRGEGNIRLRRSARVSLPTAEPIGWPVVALWGL
jgi:hypothetical protein